MIRLLISLFSHLIWTTSGLVALFCLGGAEGAEPHWQLEFLSDLNIPSGTPYQAVGRPRQAPPNSTAAPPDQNPGRGLIRKDNEDFGGISGIAFDATSATLYALSDSAIPVVFTFQLTLAGHRLQLAPRTPLRLRDPEGTPLPNWTLDPEGIALSPYGTLWVASEGYASRTPPVPPAIMEFGLDGSQRRTLTIPEKFLPATAGDMPRGVAANKGLESLTVATDGSQLFTATEQPLRQDRSGCGLNEECVVRVLEYAGDAGALQPVHEYAYPLDSLQSPPGFSAAEGSVGLSDLLFLGGRQLLAIERGFVVSRPSNETRNRIRLYQLDLSDATDLVGSTGPLPAASGIPVAKSLVLDLDDIVDRLQPGFQKLDNFEGICHGPRLEDGSPTILLVSDNNFSSRQRTAFLLFRLRER